MATRRSPPPQAAVAPIKDSLDRWRSKRGRGRSIPDELWRGAARLAADHGVHRVSKALRLNYYALKRRVDALEVADEASSPQADVEPSESAMFVEIPMAASTTQPSPTEIEIESPSGWRIRIRLGSLELPQELDVARLAEVLARVSS